MSLSSLEEGLSEFESMLTSPRITIGTAMGPKLSNVFSRNVINSGRMPEGGLYSAPMTTFDNLMNRLSIFVSILVSSAMVSCGKLSRR